MAKYIKRIIHSCAECPHSKFHWFAGGNICFEKLIFHADRINEFTGEKITFEARTIPDYPNIPDWCPLEGED